VTAIQQGNEICAVLGFDSVEWQLRTDVSGLPIGPILITQ